MSGTSLDGATVTLVSQGINSDGTATPTFSYNPESSTAFESLQVGQTATDTFTYTATDQHGNTSTATVTVLVSETDHVTEIGRAHV